MVCSAWDLLISSHLPRALNLDPWIEIGGEKEVNTGTHEHTCVHTCTHGGGGTTTTNKPSLGK